MYIFETVLCIFRLQNVPEEVLLKEKRELPLSVRNVSGNSACTSKRSNECMISKPEERIVLSTEGLFETLKCLWYNINVQFIVVDSRHGHTKRGVTARSNI